MALCPLYGPLSPLRPSVPSTTLCPLYSHLFPLRPSVPSTALCPLYGPLSPSTALCPLYGPLSPLKNSETSKTTHSSGILSDNHEITIIALAKKIAIIAIIVFREKLKTPFRINPSQVSHLAPSAIWVASHKYTSKHHNNATRHMCTHVHTSHRHYYSSLLSTRLPFFLAGWLTPTHRVGHNNLQLISHIYSIDTIFQREV
jgi:hypothetical protein